MNIVNLQNITDVVPAVINAGSRREGNVIPPKTIKKKVIDVSEIFEGNAGIN